MRSRPWCVRLNLDGSFRAAKPATGRLCFTLDQWRNIDREAAEQFVVPNDDDRDVQQQFMAACGH